MRFPYRLTGKLHTIGVSCTGVDCTCAQVEDDGSDGEFNGCVLVELQELDGSSGSHSTQMYDRLTGGKY